MGCAAVWRAAFFAGNRALLELPLTAYLAARGEICKGGQGGKGERFFALTEAALTGDARPRCVISGFMSPLEREVLDVCLAEEIPAVQVLARGLPNWFPAPVRRAMDAGRFLAITPFEVSVERFSAERAAWCNQYVLHLAQRIVIGQLAPDGMLACLLADLAEDNRVIFLGSD